jgi:signal transduction histidine kinase
MSSDANHELVARPHWTRTFAFRVNAWYVAIFLASITLIVAAITVTARHAVGREASLVLERRLARHVAVLELGLPTYVEAAGDSAALDEQTAVRVRDRGGQTLYERGDVNRARLVASRATSEMQLEIGTVDDPWSTALERMRPGVIALAVAALALAVFGGYYLTRRGLAPIRELAAVARMVSQSGDLSRRVPVRDTGDELEELGVLFNRMLDRNQRLVHGMREALDNVAHDLRTPLARIRGTAELALREDQRTDGADALAVVIEESDRVLAMLRAITEISEAETGLMRLHVEPVSLRNIAVQIAELYEQVTDDAGVAVEIMPPDATVSADPTRLRQAVANLVDNAIKHTPRGGKVTIEVSQDRDEAYLVVRDTGEGIPAESLPRVWERLYRADPSRSKRGLGLGLSVVKAIVTAHGGRVAVESALGRGSAFTIALPRVASAIDRTQGSA